MGQDFMMVLQYLFPADFADCRIITSLQTNAGILFRRWHPPKADDFCEIKVMLKRISSDYIFCEICGKQKIQDTSKPTFGTKLR